jgi:uncharacterized protein (DUF433 family)
MFRDWRREQAPHSPVSQFDVPIDDGCAPTGAVVKQFYNAASEVAERCHRGERTFIHSTAGHGRTGVFGVAVLMLLGDSLVDELPLRYKDARRYKIFFSHEHVTGGRPCVRGTRVTVGLIIGMLASGHDRDEVSKLYPYLTSEDIDAALSYAAWRADEQEVMATGQQLCATDGRFRQGRAVNIP